MHQILNKAARQQDNGVENLWTHNLRCFLKQSSNELTSYFLKNDGILGMQVV